MILPISKLPAKILRKQTQPLDFPLKKTAQTSFAIYFIHPFLIPPLTRLPKVLGLNFHGNLFTLLITTAVMVGLSIAIAQLIKLIFKKNSRYIIGW